MKTVLFATDHMPPDPEALDYALLLCRRMAARLEVLHILKSSSSAGSGDRRRRKGKIPARHKTICREGMPTGAQTGVPETDRISAIQSLDRLKQWLPDRPNPPVVYHCEVAGGATGAIIERYVRKHGEIVLTVFDPSSDRHPADIRSKAKGEMPRLSIPLVLVKKAR